MTEAFYALDGDLATPSELTRGPWDPNSQHAGPPAALLTRALELCERREGSRIGRVTVEILAPVPIAPLTVSARVVRPGRSVELLEASLEGPDGEVMRRGAGASPSGRHRCRLGAGQPPPGRETARRSSSSPPGAGGLAHRMEILFARGGFLDPGPATVWMRPRVALVEGETIRRSSARCSRPTAATV